MVQKILLIDDSTDIHRLVRKVLEGQDITVLSASCGHEGLAVALRERPNLILLDYLMPDLDGLAVLGLIKHNPDYASLTTTPVILITGHDSPAFISQAFAAGAVDYVRKPINCVELQVRVAAGLRTQSLVKDLYRRVMFDDLTGLPNRNFLRDGINDLLTQFEQHPERQFALLLLNLDRFKLVNDSLGHGCGNDLLQIVAERLKQCATEVVEFAGEPTVARVGGDEFAVLLSGHRSTRRVEQFAENIVNALAQRYEIDGRTLYLDAGLGIVFSHRRYRSADEILRDADTAMNSAKSSGRGSVKVFDHSMRLRAESLLQLDTDLRQAIEQEQFLLLYQPILDLQSGLVASAEALVRWNHPTRGWISPIEFIPAAEESGLIVELGEWILRTACNQLAAWTSSDATLAPPKVNVNVARAQLLQPGFAPFVRRVLQETRLPAERLTLEVTESGVMTDLERSVATLQELRELGCQIHLDDFGTGYSSLSCLYQFPIDALKLDRSLVSNLSGKHYLGTLVNFVLQLAKAMNIRVTAEGIESLEQAQTLARWGCDFGQGFYFAKPLLQESIPAFVANMRKSGFSTSPPKDADRVHSDRSAPPVHCDLPHTFGQSTFSR
ncbi:MAG: EAL domain-containing protein [Pirellulales bacterium]